MKRPVSLRLLVASCAVLLLLAVGCDRGGGATAKVTPIDGGGGVTLTAAGTRFSLARIEVTAGTAITITLANRDEVAHTLRIYGGSAADSDVVADTGEVAPGDTGEAVVLFASPGDYPFRCAIHPQQMRGTLIVR